jgi:hypothetical protein
MKNGDIIHHVVNSKDGLFVLKITPRGTTALSFGYYVESSLSKYKWRPTMHHDNWYKILSAYSLSYPNSTYILCNYYDIPKEQRKSLMVMLKTDKETAMYALEILKTYKK